VKSSDPTSRLVVLSVDGMNPGLYRRANELGLKVPNILELAERGASAEAVESVFPTTTYPAHATLATGVPPNAHGIYSHLASLDPTEKARPWHWFAAAIRVPTLWSLARAHGRKTAAISWPVSAGAPIDFNIPEIWDPAAPDPHQDLQTVAKHSTQRLFDELTRALKPAPHTEPDRLRGEAALHLWKKHRPDLMLVHFVGYDDQAHRHGPRAREALRALELTDHEIGRLREAVAGDANVTLVVLSDHGFLPVEKEVSPLVILREEGLFGTRSKRHPELKRLGAVHAGGSFAVFWLEEPSTLEQRALARALERIQETGAVAEVVDRAKLERLGSDPDAEWILDAADGFCFTDRFDGPVVRSGSRDRGTHGHLPTRAGMEASFIAAGPGIVPGRNLGRIQLMDVAPTLARLLGVAFDELAGEAEPLDLSG
jgi:predicted AlkP superfamily pyrophosphatase or phosphodiesterase